MRTLFVILFCALLTPFLYGQTPVVATDTTIYDTPESTAFPLMSSCQQNQHVGWNRDSVRRCGENQLLRIISQNLRYPEEARSGNIQGTVVTQFVVERDGRISQVKILKDIGGGCGTEAVRLLKILDTLGLRFQPAEMGGIVVRSRSVLPLRFKLTEAIPFYINDSGDTIYSMVDTDPAYKKGADSLLVFILNNLNYPRKYRDSCHVGVIELSLLVAPNGSATIDTYLDFSNLGMDFQFEAVRLINRTKGAWEPATYKGVKVPSTIPVRTLFKSSEAGCSIANEKFDRAMILASEGIALSEINKTEEAIGKWSEALALQPNNAELLYYRGTMLLNTEKRDDACKDYNRIKELLGTTWFEPIRRLMCP